jgi:uncharacterized protein (DUF58 family)
LFVREREWEAAHTAWLWVDLSPSMRFQSFLAPVSKENRAIVLALALSELLARGGERIGSLGDRTFTGRHAARRVAEAIAHQAGDAQSLPPKARLGRFSESLLFGDFLQPLPEAAPRLEAIASQGVRGHLVQILDPAEETLPYQGRTEFVSIEGRERVTVGRAEALRERYQARIKQHRSDLAALAKKLDWSFLVHHTDRPAEEVVLALHNRLAGLETDYRYRTPSPAAEALSTTGSAS